MDILIIGSGIAGVTVAQSILESSESCCVTMITRDREFSYHRPMLSHSIGSDNLSLLTNKTFEQLRLLGIDVIEAAEVSHIDAEKQHVEYFKNDAQLLRCYDKLILATGSSATIPVEYNFLKANSYVLHSMDDLLRMREFVQHRRLDKKQFEVAILGAGAIGCELASEFHHLGAAVTLVHRNKFVADRLLDLDQSKKLTEHFDKIGINLKLEKTVQSAVRTNDHMTLFGESPEDKIGTFDMVILSFGFSPNILLAKNADIRSQRGIVVDSFFQTSAKNVYAIGDGAEVQGKIYQYVYPIWEQAQFLAKGITQGFSDPWMPPPFSVHLKIHNYF